MLRVTQKDYNFFLLCSYIKSPPPDSSKLIKIIQTFRSKLSLKWLDMILDDEDPIDCLKYVWLVLFKLSTHNDATVRVSVYNTIGGLLFTILPFSPHHIMDSFSKATQEYKLTTRASICIVSSFLYICNFISPSDLEDFVTNTPVIPHFGADVSGFIQYIPKLVQLMSPLDVQFHKVLLRSLLSSFGRKPNHDFVKSVVLLVAFNPEVLIKDLMEFIISNSLNQTILAIGPQILLNDSIFELLSENYISYFLNASLSVISGTENTLSEFEQACGTLSTLVNRYEGEKLEDLKVKIKKHTTLDDGQTLKDYPKHFQRLLLQLPTPLDELKIDPKDANSIKCAKINALVNYSRKTDDRQPVLEMFHKLNETIPDGDVLTSLINALQPLFPLFLHNDSEEDDIVNFRKENRLLSELIRSILLRENMTWLQNVSILNLLLSMGIDLGNKLIPDFEEIVIPLILSFCCSPQNELSSVATSTLGAFVNLNNIQTVKSFLWSVNYFEPHSALPFIVILNIVADAVGVDQLKEFTAIVGEMIIFYPNDPEIAGNGFNFINKCKYFGDIPNAIISSCIDWITRLYLSITQDNSRVSSPLKNEPLTPLISTVETDVVASDLLDIRSKLLPLLYCYKYFISLKGVLSPYCVLFTKDLMRIFPDAVIPIMKKVPSMTVKSEFSEMPDVICSILKCAPTLETASCCCEFLLSFASNECLSKQKDLINFFVTNSKVLNGKYLYHFYHFLSKVTPSKSEELLSKIKQRLDTVNLAIFEMKQGSFTIEKFIEFKSKVEFANWPQSVLHFFKEHTKLNSEKQVENCDFTVELNADQLESLDFAHFSFFYHNRERFIVDQQVYESYAKKHRHFIAKLEFHYVEKHFNYEMVSESVKRVPTILPQVVNSINNNGEVDATSEPLIYSFFMFTKFRVTQNVIDNIIEQTNSPKIALSILNYADKFKFNVSDDQIINLIKNIQNSNKNNDQYEQFMIAASKKISKDKIKEFEELINKEKNPSTPFSCLSFPNSVKLWYDADQYLNEIRSELLMNGEEICLKAKKLFPFCKILSQSPKFDSNELFSLLSTIILPTIPSVSSSSKKILSILRVLNESITLNKRNIPPKFLEELKHSIISLQSSEISLVFNEFSMIFTILFDVSEQPELFNFCESFDKVVTKTSLFIIPQSVALSHYSDHLTFNRITKSGLNEQLNSTEIPSQRLHAIQAMDKLLNSRSYWTLITQVLSSTIKTYQEFSNRPFFDTALVKFSTILSSDINFESIRQTFSQKVLPFFFVEPNTPSFRVFAEAASVATQQIGPPLPIYMKFIDKLMKSKPIEPNAGHYYREFVQWLLKNEKDEIRRSDILLEELAVMQKIYAADPSPENSEGLIEAIHQPPEGIDVNLLLFGKIALLKVSKLQVVVLVHKFYKIASEEEKVNCKAIFESLCDSYDPVTANAVRLVLDGKSLEAASC